MDADFRRLAAFHLIPFGWRRDQLSVAVASGDVGHHGRRQRGGFADLFSLFGDHAFAGQLTQHALQLGAVGVFEAEFPRDLAGSDISRMPADEGDDGVSGRKSAVAVLCHLTRGPCRRSSSRRSLQPLPARSSRSLSPARAPCWRHRISALPPILSRPLSWRAWVPWHRPRLWRALPVWLSWRHAWA